MIRTAVSQALRGFCMGAADIVPGVSGGTVALVLGIYEDLVANIRQGARALGRLVRGDARGCVADFRKIDWLFIGPLLVGITVAVALLAGLIENALRDHPEKMAGLFFGLVSASIVTAWRLIRHPARIQFFVALVVGAGVFVLLGFQSGPVADPSIVVFLGSGAVAICAMILPGISGSFLLLMMGMYTAVLGAVHDRAVLELGVFLMGAVIGLALFSSLLTWLLDRYKDIMLAGLIGLMIGSLRVLWPWPNGVGIISDIDDEVIDGTGLEWPSGNDWVAPLLLAICALVIVIVIAQLTQNRERDATD